MDTNVKISNMENLVSYHDGSVVSKTVIKKQTGTVTLFAFDKDETLSTHSASFDAMVYVLDGRVEIIISEKVYTLKKGEMIVMPSNEPHSLKAITKFKFLLIMIKS